MEERRELFPSRCIAGEVITQGHASSLGYPESGVKSSLQLCHETHCVGQELKRAQPRHSTQKDCQGRLGTNLCGKRGGLDGHTTAVLPQLSLSVRARAIGAAAASAAGAARACRHCGHSGGVFRSSSSPLVQTIRCILQSLLYVALAEFDLPSCPLRLASEAASEPFKVCAQRSLMDKEATSHAREHQQSIVFRAAHRARQKRSVHPQLLPQPNAR
mmetsp:Transcript_22384/g.76696  ORF Transcript_22384/g.76696 Transcript_22384/m.76696 type:complete len:216 (+) Transcript_22384:751-1398(+)